MKKLFLVIISVMFSTNLFSMEYGSYQCSVETIEPLYGTNVGSFGTKKGKVNKNNKEYTYLIVYTKERLFFTNTGNEAQSEWDFSNLKNNFKIYKDNWYQFKMSTVDNEFIFSVNKANFNANYIGTCINTNTPVVTNNRYVKTVIFNGFSDPGVLADEAWKEYSFYYKGFTYENISTWEPGRILQFFFTPEKGVYLYDRASNTTARVEFPGEHPIDLITKECIKKNSSTMGMTSCYENEFDIWDTIMNRVYNELKQSYSKEDFKVIRQMQRNWLKYRDSQYEVNVMTHKDERGTISIIESASRVLNITRQQALYLLSIPKKDK